MADPRADGFLGAEEEQEIIDAILQAEQHTSGEIRVHIEEGGLGKKPFDRAKELFYRLKMDNTRASNGVLFYLALKDRSFAIYGDSGINAVVPEGFWNDTRDILENHFKKGAFKKGLVEGILKAGSELSAHFPWHAGNTNELRNDISKG